MPRTGTLAPTALLALACAAGLAACDTAPRSDSDREALGARTNSTLRTMTSTDPSLSNLLDKSVAYAIFPDIGKAGFIAGGAYGRGEVFQNGRFIGWADITQGSVGLQAGAQSYDELIIFLDQRQLDAFTSNQFTLSANMSAVALREGAAGAADHSKGVIVFVQPRGGLMAELSVGGQRFTFQPASDNNNSRGYNNTPGRTFNENPDRRYRRSDY